MKQPHSLLKLGAIVSAVLLVAGFVGYRAGAFDRFLSTSTPVDPENGTISDDFLLMAGSKSAPVFQPSAQPPADGKQADPAFMGGSKTLVFPLIPPKSPGAQAPSPSPPHAPPIKP